jgi:ABC-type lipoprotein release transport system permease subunit
LQLETDTALRLQPQRGVAVVIGRSRFGITTRDAATYVLVAISLAIISAVACAIPARRAARVDPVVALRGE